MLRQLATAFLAAFWLLAPAVSAAFTIFHSPNDDGANAGVASLPLGQDFTLYLWFDPGEQCFDYVVFLQSDSGIDLVGFSGDVTVIANTDGFPRELGVTGGDISTGQNGATRIGTITGATGDVPGAQLRFASGTFSDANLETVLIDDVPQVIAVVWEPSGPLLGAAALGALAVAGKTRGYGPL